MLYMPEDSSCVDHTFVLQPFCVFPRFVDILSLCFSYGDGETCNGAGATVVYNNTIYSPTGNISVSAIAQLQRILPPFDVLATQKQCFAQREYSSASEPFNRNVE